MSSSELENLGLVLQLRIFPQLGIMHRTLYYLYLVFLYLDPRFVRRVDVRLAFEGARRFILLGLPFFLLLNLLARPLAKPPLALLLLLMLPLEDVPLSLRYFITSFYNHI